jgi:hypothetical protein
MAQVVSPSSLVANLHHGGHFLVDLVASLAAGHRVWCHRPVSGGEGGSVEALDTIALQSSWWWRRSAWADGRDHMVLGTTILVVGVAVRHARGGAGHHGGGWQRRATSVRCLLDTLVLAVVEVGRGGLGWRGRRRVRGCCCRVFILCGWVGGSLNLHRAKALHGSGQGRRCQHLRC